MIRLLSKEEMSEIYEIYMTRDFPRNELKPLAMLEEPFYSCYGYFEDDKLMGYAVLVACEENRCLLLDYFAVLSEVRGCGKGMRFLMELKEMCKDWQAMLIESEAEKSEIAIKRIRFYERAAAKATSLIINLYSVDYRILMIPCSKELSDLNVRIKIEEIYKMIYSAAFLERYVQYRFEA